MYYWKHIRNKRNLIKIRKKASKWVTWSGPPAGQDRHSECMKINNSNFSRSRPKRNHRAVMLLIFATPVFCLHLSFSCVGCSWFWRFTNTQSFLLDRSLKSKGRSQGCSYFLCLFFCRSCHNVPKQNYRTSTATCCTRRQTTKHILLNDPASLPKSWFPPQHVNKMSIQS